MRWLFAFLLGLAVCLVGFARYTVTVGVVGDSISNYKSYMQSMSTHLHLYEYTQSGLRCDELMAGKLTDLLSEQDLHAVVSMCGTNDINQGQDPAATVTEVETMVAMIQADGSIPVILTPPPQASPYDAGLRAAMASFVSLLVASGTANGYTVINIWQPFMDYDDVEGQEMDNLYVGGGDWVHPNWAGYIFIAEIINPTLDSLFPPPAYESFD